MQALLNNMAINKHLVVYKPGLKFDVKDPFNVKTGHGSQVYTHLLKVRTDCEEQFKSALEVKKQVFLKDLKVPSMVKESETNETLKELSKFVDYYVKTDAEGGWVYEKSKNRKVNDYTLAYHIVVSYRKMKFDFEPSLKHTDCWTLRKELKLIINEWLNPTFEYYDNLKEDNWPSTFLSGIKEGYLGPQNLQLAQGLAFELQQKQQKFIKNMMGGLLDLATVPSPDSPKKVGMESELHKSFKLFLQVSTIEL